MWLRVFVLTFSWTLCSCSTENVTSEQMKTFISETFTAATATYNKFVFPREDFADKIELDMKLKLKAITSFNEVAGTIELIGFLTIIWHDQLVDDAYDVTKHGEFVDTLINQDYVWKPAVSLFNSAKAIIPVGDLSNLVRLERITTGTYLNYSKMTWNPGVVTKTGCFVEVKNFPFDKQICNVTFTPWGHPYTEIEFMPSLTVVDLDEYEENSEWMLTKTEVLTKREDGESFINFRLYLTRRPTYFLLNMIMPILILGVLNALAFLLPTESGERVGYSITAFLTFAVYLTLVAAVLPRSSSPMSLLSYFLMAMVVVSSVASIVTVFTLKVYFKDEDERVPDALATFVACLNCIMCKKKPPKYDDEYDEEIALLDKELDIDRLSDTSENLKKKEEAMEGLTTLSDDSDEGQSKYGVDWKMVAGTLDMFSFVAVCGASVAIAVVFLVPLAAQM